MSHILYRENLDRDLPIAVAGDDCYLIDAAGKRYLTFAAGVGEGETIQWIRVACFGDRAQELASLLRKGSRVYCEGRLRLDEWESKDGDKRRGIHEHQSSP